VTVDALSTLEFWSLPPQEREPLFAQLRANDPVSWHEPPEDILGLEPIEDDGYWAIVCYDDVRRISRHPKSFCSGRGVLFGDAPPEMLEATQSFLAMDAGGIPIVVTRDEESCLLALSAWRELASSVVEPVP